MNIRTLTNPVTAVESATAAQGLRPVKTEISSEDRDANGRRDPDEENKNPLNDEEMNQAKKYLEELEGLKANHLSLTVEEGGEYRIFVINDASGLTVRRIVEWEMRPLLMGSAKKTGQIFDKSA